MLERMFLFTKTTTKLEVVAIISLIAGLILFISPQIFIMLITGAALFAIWVAIPQRTLLKIALSIAAIIGSTFLLNALAGFLAITLVGIGSIGIASMMVRFVMSEVKQAKSENASDDYYRDDEEDVEDLFKV